MDKHILEAINRFSMLENINNVTVALSGGADSMALLNALNSLKGRLGFTLNAAHLNHMIRGEEAIRDEEFVKEQCQKLSIPLFCERIDVPAYAKAHKLSTELAARELRYMFLEHVNTGAVATAHTASDNLETMLFNLTRGSALKGICGIPPKRGIFIRPLIFCTRQDVENYCLKNNISFVTDSTNLSDDYTRNKIRHNIIPVLKQINPSVERAAERTAVSVTEDELFLTGLAEKFVAHNAKNGGLDVTDLPNIAIAKRAIKIFSEIFDKKMSLDNHHISEIYGICRNEGKISLPLNMSAVVKDGILKIINNEAESQVDFRYSVTTECQNYELYKNCQKINNLFLNNTLDCDKINGKLNLRTRLPGDSIRLSGHGCTKTLKKLMNEVKIPQNERDVLPVLADDVGVVWICGIGVSARCAVTEKTKQIMIIKALKEQNNMD